MISSLAVQMGAYESMYEHSIQVEDRDNTLFLQLTVPDVVLIWMGMALLERLYGPELVEATQQKFVEVIEAQEFYMKTEGGNDDD